MSTPLPFAVARDIGNNIASGMRQTRDENAIEKILSDAIGTGDPSVVQNSIGKILSQVSPDRQGMALQYLQNTFQGIQKKQDQQAQFKREQDAGLVPGINPTAQAAIYKEKSKGARLAPYGLNGDPNAPLNQPTAANGTSPYLSGTEGAPQGQPKQVPQSVFKRLTKDQLITATGHPDREVSEPAKAELKNREHEEAIHQKRDDIVFKSDLNRSNKLLEKANEVAASIPQKRTALSLMNDAIVNKNLGWLSADNLAEITGIEGFRSKEGAIFKTAGKEYFLGSISRAGTRPNQWIEQQISDMMTKIGRETSANLTVARALQNELDLEEETVRATHEIADRLSQDGDLAMSKLGPELTKHMAEYSAEKQHELFNDMRAIKAIDEKTPQKYQKVKKGTQVSKYMAQALLRQFNNDPKKAAEEAKKLGYEF